MLKVFVLWGSLFLAEVLMAKSQAPNMTAVDLWTHRLLKTSKAWNNEIFGGNVTIGLIGTGMELNHFQTTTLVYTNFNEDPTNGIDDDHNGYIDDVRGWNFLDQNNSVGNGNGKSTDMTGVMVSNHCAGPIRGLAPYTQVIPLQALSDQGQDDQKIIEAMKYAVNLGAQILLFESSVDLTSSALQKELHLLETQNVMVILPAGDEGKEVLRVQRSANVVVVGATNSQDQFAVFSNYGDGVDLAAPGENVWTTIGMENEDPFAAKSHTGLAAAHVAGALALLISAEPDLTIQDMQQRLAQGVDPRPFQVQARGRLNIAKLLKLR